LQLWQQIGSKFTFSQLIFLCFNGPPLRRFSNIKTEDILYIFWSTNQIGAKNLLTDQASEEIASIIYIYMIFYGYSLHNEYHPGAAMNKSELIEALAQKQNVTIRTASKIVNTILESMTETLGKGDNIELRGFGSFSVREYDSYIGRNPKTGKEITVKAKKSTFFKVGKELRKAVDSSRD
jgi:integration host factor subunit beta